MGMHTNGAHDIASKAGRGRVSRVVVIVANIHLSSDLVLHVHRRYTHLCGASSVARARRGSARLDPVRHAVPLHPHEIARADIRFEYGAHIFLVANLGRLHVKTAQHETAAVRWLRELHGVKRERKLPHQVP